MGRVADASGISRRFIGAFMIRASGPLSSPSDVPTACSNLICGGVTVSAVSIHAVLQKRFAH